MITDHRSPITNKICARKRFFILTACLTFFFLFAPAGARAQAVIGSAEAQLGEAVGRTGVAQTDVATAAGEVVRILLSGVGVIFLILMLYAGVKWMTARGEEEAVTKARKAMIAASIGLVIIVSAYGFSVLVTSGLLEGVGPSGGPAGELGGWEVLPVYEVRCTCSDGFESGRQVDAESDTAALSQIDCSERCSEHTGVGSSRAILVQEGIRAAGGSEIGCCYDKIERETETFEASNQYWTWRITTQADCEARGNTPEPLDVLVGPRYWKWNPWDAERCEAEFDSIEQLESF